MTQNKNLPSTGHVLETLRNVFKYVLSAPPKSQQKLFFFFSTPKTRCRSQVKRLQPCALMFSKATTQMRPRNGPLIVEDGDVGFYVMGSWLMCHHVLPLDIDKI